MPEPESAAHDKGTSAGFDLPVSGSPGQTARPQPASEPGAQKAAPESSYQPPPRRPHSARPNAFNGLAWLLEGITGLSEELRHHDLGLPEEFWLHAMAARKEALLATRALIDHAIARGDSAAAQVNERRQRRQRRGAVDIDFD